MISAQLFTEDGRRYVRGTKDDRCNFAYLETPRIRGDNGRVAIHARFTGRTSVGLFGRCVGLGDAFDVVVTAAPHFRDGGIGFREVSVRPANGGGFYAHSVSRAMAASLERDFRYPLAAEAKRALEDPGAQPGYRRELKRFNVPAIRVTHEAVVLTVDFEMVVK